MKQTKKLTVTLLLALVLAACNMPTPTAVTIHSDPTAAIPKEGFGAGTPLDGSSLPALALVPSGGEPVSCFVENTEPSISLGYGMFPYQTLCLNHFPVAPDSPDFTLTLTDPTGSTFHETFAYQEDGIVNSRGRAIGFIEDGSGIDGNPATPGVTVEIYMPASLPCGDWSVSASTQDNAIRVEPTTLTLDCQPPRLSVLSDLSTDPFIFPEYGREGPSFANGENIYFVGTAFPPNTAITLALYQEDPAAGKSDTGRSLGTAKYAVSIVTDGSGNFQASFVVGSATQRGAYYAIAAPTITADMGLSHFNERFSIK